MGYAQVLSRAQVGLNAPLVRVEVHLSSGLPSFMIVGLAAPVVRESKERVRAALAHCGFEFPAGRITVNLAPADLPKEGGRFDLPIAIGILVASGQAKLDCDLNTMEFYGELALTGELKPVPGLLLAALHAAREGHHMTVPTNNIAALRQIEALQLKPAQHLLEFGTGDSKLPRAAQIVSSGEQLVAGATFAASLTQTPPHTLELAEVRGQWHAKRALLIAAAGGHSLLMLGPPGSGKSMLAQRLPGLLPPLSRDEALEVAAIAAVAECATSELNSALPSTRAGMRPFRAPHHTASAHAIVGGGVAVRPGEVSLAHHGVLFLDELPEFDRRVLEALREPLESGSVSVVRANQRADYPARFQLVAAMNPCPCGRAGQVHPACRCPPSKLQQYRARISGPLLDRIDLQLHLPPVESADLVESGNQCALASTYTTAAAREVVNRARQLQHTRQGMCNARLTPEATLQHCSADAEGTRLLRRAAEAKGYSARSQHRVLRVARTIADVANRDRITREDTAEALAMRWE
jgi:magnesium chelatase family protein